MRSCIAGSPSVGANNAQASKTVVRDIHSSSLLNFVGSLPKDTPTQNPRISSQRTSAISTPPPKNTSLLGYRASVNTTGAELSPTPGSIPMDEFGVMDDGDNLALKSAPSLAGQLQNTTRSSRPRQNALVEPLRYLLRLMCEDRKDVEMCWRLSMFATRTSPLNPRAGRARDSLSFCSTMTSHWHGTLGSIQEVCGSRKSHCGPVTRQVSSVNS
jgi:hypothetical protein